MGPLSGLSLLLWVRWEATGRFWTQKGSSYCCRLVTNLRSGLLPLEGQHSAENCWEEIRFTQGLALKQMEGLSPHRSILEESEHKWLLWKWHSKAERPYAKGGLHHPAYVYFFLSVVSSYILNLIAIYRAKRRLRRGITKVIRCSGFYKTRKMTLAVNNLTI